MFARIRGARVALPLAALVLSTALVLVPDAEAEEWSPRPAVCGVETKVNEPIEVNGVVLRANISWPTDPGGEELCAGPFPVLITQTPYKKGTAGAFPYAVERGYVTMIVDVRGTGQSEGIYSGTFSGDEQSDGAALVEWAAAQPWSTGDVGLFGASYLAVNQFTTAAKQPPHLRAIFPVVPTGDNYRTNFPGGYTTSLAAFALLYPANGVELPDGAADDPLDAYRRLSTRPVGVAAGGANVAGLMAGDSKTYETEFVHTASPLVLIAQDKIKVPTFVAGGWQDALSQRDGPLLFRELRKKNVPTKLVMGPWTHTSAGSGLPADGFPWNLDALQVRWFDRYVRGIDDPALDDWGPAWLYKGGDTWHSVGAAELDQQVTGWTPSTVAYDQAFLGPGALARGSARPSDLPAGTTVIAGNPVGGMCTGSTYVGTFGIPPQTPCTNDNRVNDLTTTNFDLPLPEGVDLTGPLSARLFTSTNGRDAHVVVRVEDVAPDGAVKELSTGWDTLSFWPLATAGDGAPLSDIDPVTGLVARPHHDYHRDAVQTIEAGHVYEWWIEIRPTSARIPAGHTLRLAIQTADTVRFVPTARSLTENAGAVVTIHHDATYPSALILPVDG